ncbi:MAG: glycosyltransferase family 9 protein [Dialister sp.]|nr:glycosyltransferase family 9 protein [Dialister sp.]
MVTSYKNILMIKMSSLGDVIHALPSLYVLRKTYPKAHITWAVHEAFAEILPGKPWIDELYIVDRKRIRNLSYLIQVRRDLHARRFDLVIDLQMIAKSAVVSFLSGCSNRIGYNDAREGSFLASKPIAGVHKQGHIIEQLLDVTRYLGCSVDRIEFPLHSYATEMDTIRDILAARGVKGNFVVLVPGTRGERKKWPVEYWGALAKKLAEREIFTILAGTKSEYPMGEEIQRISSSRFTINMMGETSLLELCALEKLAALHISGDTGPLHIANAVHTPVLALFGPTLPDRSGPYGNSNSEVLMADNPGSDTCSMGSIPVDRVFERAVRKLHSL